MEEILVRKRLQILIKPKFIYAVSPKSEVKEQKVGGQIHGYVSKKELVSELIDIGFYISFGYLHPREEELKKIVKITPLEQILTETDSPYHIMESPKKFILLEDIVLVTK
jgi:Tat protein secretion system quality control protein TatD with DNase activity